jgi:uncharacterized protein YcgL (UPF0745 family)
MQCYIYKSSKKQNLYLYIQNKDNFSSVPEALFNSLGKLELIIELDLTPERKLAKEDPVKVIASLNQKGYFLQLLATDIPPPLQLQ